MKPRLFFYSILLSCTLLLTAQGRTAKDQHSVLVISSYSPVKENGNKVIASFTSTLNGLTRNNVKVYVDYMDSESDSSFDAWKAWMTQMFRAYQFKPSAVVILGGEAWSTYRTTCPGSWKDIPVVLGMVKEGFIDYEMHEEKTTSNVKNLRPTVSTFGDFKVTGYYYKDYIRDNFLLIKRLDPNIRDVAFCYDNRYSLNFYDEYMSSQIGPEDSISIHMFSGDRMSTVELLDSIFNKDYTLISGGWFSDKNKYSHAFQMLHNELSRHNTRNMFLVTDQGRENMNYIGGYYILGTDLGTDLAELTFIVLARGIENAPSFGLTPSKPHYYINYPTFLASGFDPGRLPDDVVFYNEEPNLVEQHPEAVIFMIMLVLLLIVIFFAILYVRQRKNTEYKKTNRQMKRLLRSMPDMATIYDSKGNIEEIVNPKKEIMSSIDHADVVGRNITELEALFPRYADTIKAAYEMVLETARTNEVRSQTFCFRREDGLQYVSARYVPFSKGRVICFAHDETAQITAEKEILKLKTFLQSIVDNLPIGLFVKDADKDFRYIFYNHKMAEFYGNQADDVIGKNDFDLNAEEAVLLRKEDEEVLGSDRPISFEREFRDPETGLPCRWGVTTKSKLVNHDGSRYIISVMVDTTDIRRKEIELDNIRRELSNALDAGSMSAWSYDVEKRRFESLYNKSVVQDGINFDDGLQMCHPDDRGKYTRMIESLSSGNVEKFNEVVRFDRDGKYKWYETYAIGLRSDVSGKVTRIIGTEKNITDQIQRQRELREGHIKLELAFEAADMIPWEYNVAEDAFRLTSDSSDNPINRFTAEQYMLRFHPGSRAKIRQALDDMVNGKNETLNLVVQLHVEGEHYEWTQVAAKVIERGADGKALKIIGTRKFITEAVLAERKLKEYIFKSDLLIKSGGIEQWDFDNERQIFSILNSYGNEQEGRSYEEFLSTVYPDDIPIITGALDSMLRGEEDAITFQARLDIPGQGFRWKEIHGVIYERNAEGKITKITGLRRDITAMKNMMDELIILREKAEESSRLKDAFLANMSHEIRTPLNAIVGFSNLIAQTEDKDEAAEYSKIIETNNELLLQLINDILDLSKIEAGQLTFTYEDMDVVEIFDNLMQIYKSKVAEGVELVCDLPDESCIIRSEKTRITQVISNFVSNAVKFTSEGHIRMGYEHQGDGLRFFVEDTGKGISKANIPNLFNRFAKFDSFVQGTGLGLSICETIVKTLDGQIGGQIGVESEEGMGSTFWFTIPCIIINPQENRDKGSASKTVKNDNVMENFDDGMKTILVAEDNDSNYLLLSNILGKSYHLIRAVNGEEAVRLYASRHPDLILMDIKMPVMDGLEATRKIRESDSDTYIIALTAHAFEEDRRKAMEAGCNGFMTKPINVKELRDTLHSILG